MGIIPERGNELIRTYPPVRIDQMGIYCNHFVESHNAKFLKSGILLKPIEQLLRARLHIRIAQMAIILKHFDEIHSSGSKMRLAPMGVLFSNILSNFTEYANTS